MTLDLTKLTVTPEMLDILADTASQILRVGQYELAGDAWSRRTYEFAWEMPNVLLQYGFTNIDELNEPPILEYILTIPDEPVTETKDGSNTETDGTGNEGDRCLDPDA